MQSKYIRTIGIVLAVILSMAAIFYIGGLVNQFNLNYQKWLAEGGITGKATMDAICFSPVCCWRSAMTASGLKCVALVAVIGSGVYLFIHFQDRFGNGDYDPRNFSRSKRGTYGTAGWMSDKEMRAILEISSPGHAKGIILGKTEKGAVICLPEDTRLNKHIAVFGASGTMPRNHPPGAVPEYPARGIRGDFRSKIRNVCGHGRTVSQARLSSSGLQSVTAGTWRLLELYVRPGRGHPHGTGAYRCHHRQHEGRW